MRTPLLVCAVVLTVAVAAIAAGLSGALRWNASTGLAFVCVGLGSLTAAVAGYAAVATGDRATFVAPQRFDDGRALKLAGRQVLLGSAWLLLGGFDLVAPFIHG